MANAVDDRTYGIHVDHLRSRQRRRLPCRRQHRGSGSDPTDVRIDGCIAAVPGFTGVHAESTGLRRYVHSVLATHGRRRGGLRCNKHHDLDLPGRSGMTKHSTKRTDRTGPLWWITSIVSWTLLLAISAVIVATIVVPFFAGAQRFT